MQRALCNLLQKYKFGLSDILHGQDMLQTIHWCTIRREKKKHSAKNSITLKPNWDRWTKLFERRDVVNSIYFVWQMIHDPCCCVLTRSILALYYIYYPFQSAHTTYRISFWYNDQWVHYKFSGDLFNPLTVLIV